jgi:hypothetical protein
VAKQCGSRRSWATSFRLKTVGRRTSAPFTCS